MAPTHRSYGLLDENWLTLATSYRDADFAQWLIDEAEYVDELFVRPVIEVG